jgi:hypothetical protein
LVEKEACEIRKKTMKKTWKKKNIPQGMAKDHLSRNHHPRHLMPVALPCSPGFSEHATYIHPICADPKLAPLRRKGRQDIPGSP